MFSPTITNASTAIPGVTFSVHRIGMGRRTDIDLLCLKDRQRMRELEADFPAASPRETELNEQLEIAQAKALALDAVAFTAVTEGEVKPLEKELAASIPPDVSKTRSVLNVEYALVDRRIRAQWIRSGLIAIVHRDPDGAPVEEGIDGMTADQLLEYGPENLAQEIYTALIGDGKLLGAGTKNLRSPTTSGAVAGGQSPNTTAPLAEAAPTPSTSIAIVSGTSPET